MNIESTTLLGLDLGTTHCKAGLFALDGRGLYIASLDNPAQRGPQGYSYYVPEAMWRNVEALLAGARWALAQKEATLSGAALLAGIGGGVYADAQSAAERLSSGGMERYEPDAAKHDIYRGLFETGYLPLQGALREFGGHWR